MIYILFLIIKTVSEQLCSVGGDGIILEETTPTGIETFHRSQSEVQY